MNPEGVTHAPLYLTKTLLLSATRVMTLGRKIECQTRFFEAREFPTILITIN